MPRLAGAIAVLLAASAPLFADEPVHRIRVVMRAATPADRELLARIRGQASDLDVEIVEWATGPLEPDLSGQLKAASAFAATQRATVAFWFDLRSTGATDDRVLVYVAEPASGRVFVRSMEVEARTDGNLPSSSVLEAAALAVRTSLHALAAGGTIGIHWQPVEKSPAPHPPPAGPPPRRRVDWFGDVGWQFAFDGLSPYGQSGPIATIGLAARRLHAALALSAGLPATLSDARSTVELARYSAAAELGVAVVARDHLLVVTSARLGYAGFYRSTSAAAPGFQAAPPDLTSSFLVGVDVGATFRPRGGAFAITASVGVDYLPGAPTLVYLIDGMRDQPRSLWQFEPRVALAVGFYAP